MTPNSHPSYQPGRHFLQIPGPTNVPDRILRAIDRPTIDHRGKEFAHLGRECLEGMKPIFNTTRGEVFIYPGQRHWRVGSRDRQYAFPRRPCADD